MSVCAGITQTSMLAYVDKLRSYRDELNSFLADCYKKMEYLDDEVEEEW